LVDVCTELLDEAAYNGLVAGLGRNVKGFKASLVSEIDIRMELTDQAAHNLQLATHSRLKERLRRDAAHTLSRPSPQLHNIASDAALKQGIHQDCHLFCRVHRCPIGGA
jgi:Ser/Thr protein kinase RdoA (MazF antagonist)